MQKIVVEASLALAFYRQCVSCRCRQVREGDFGSLDRTAKSGSRIAGDNHADVLGCYGPDCPAYRLSCWFVEHHNVKLTVSL